MSRPHSREKRVSDSYSSVEKQSFNDEPSSSQNTSNKKSYVRRPTISFGPSYGRRSGGISKIIAIIIVVYVIFQFIQPLFSSSSSQSLDNYSGSNSYIENHETIHTADTSSDNVNYEVASGARNKYTKIIGNNKEALENLKE